MSSAATQRTTAATAQGFEDNHGASPARHDEGDLNVSTSRDGFGEIHRVERALLMLMAVAALGTVCSLALINSFDHLTTWALVNGETRQRAERFPWCVDGLMIAASAILYLDRRLHRQPDRFAVVALGSGFALSIAANVGHEWQSRIAEVVISGWPPLAGAGCVHLMLVFISRVFHVHPGPHRAGSETTEASISHRDLGLADRTVLAGSKPIDDQPGPMPRPKSGPSLADAKPDAGPVRTGQATLSEIGVGQEWNQAKTASPGAGRPGPHGNAGSTGSAPARATPTGTHARATHTGPARPSTSPGAAVHSPTANRPGQRDAQAPGPLVADRAGRIGPEPDQTQPPDIIGQLTDDQIISIIRRLDEQHGRPVGRAIIKKHARIGSGRADRLAGRARNAPQLVAAG